MNMYWVWQMGPAITELFGSARTVIIYTIGASAGVPLSSFARAYPPHLPILHGPALTAGASQAADQSRILANNVLVASGELNQHATALFKSVDSFLAGLRDAA